MRAYLYAIKYRGLRYPTPPGLTQGYKLKGTSGFSVRGFQPRQVPMQRTRPFPSRLHYGRTGFRISPVSGMDRGELNPDLTAKFEKNEKWWRL